MPKALRYPNPEEPEKRSIMAIRLLVEGCSIRSIELITGIRRDSIVDLVLIAGERCEKLMDWMIQDVPVRPEKANQCYSPGEVVEAAFSKKFESHKAASHFILPTTTSASYIKHCA